MAAILIQHPLWDQNLNSTGKRHLYLVRSEMRTLPDQCHRLAKLRMVRIVNRGGTQNMGSVWVLRRSPMPRTLQDTALGLRLAASSGVAKKAFSFSLRWSVTNTKRMRLRRRSRIPTRMRLRARCTVSGACMCSTDYLVICARASARRCNPRAPIQGVPSIAAATSSLNSSALRNAP
jgi:hypothetical protein